MSPKIDDIEGFEFKIYYDNGNHRAHAHFFNAGREGKIEILPEVEIKDEKTKRIFKNQELSKVKKIVSNRDFLAELLEEWFKIYPVDKYPINRR